ncbi:hypothetical protein SAMN06265222_10374 [Neorhodopirellula lusitana]|uniref:Uncharacterized protein n=1 Tax=Neorhodopirellula lusitana TaxID=445327 RepID=A0ABY1PW79_9BACT|nr:hypothetical protein [Neorhodopirellula lusitana]SMP50317.1 hypothetical protein SAMN06265222_10374 [Neorhodopirellula lusitana]
MGTTNSPHIHALGTMSVFYIPSHKLDDPRFYHGAQTARSAIHSFLMHRYEAYTQSPTPVKGYWVNQADEMVHDVMERFEVSFNKESEFDRLIEFLVEVCQRLDEEAIYVTRGNRSYLVTKKADSFGDD